MNRSHNLRAVLRVRGFRRLLGVRMLSHLGDGWFQAGLAGSVLFNPDKATNPLAIAIGFAMLLLPYSLIGPYVGGFLDRWSRRSILYVANVLRALLVVPAALLIFNGDEGLPFLVLSFLIIGFNRFFVAGVSAAIPHVVEDRRLVTANSLATTMGSVCFAVGIGTAAVTLAVFDLASFHGYGVIASVAVLGYTASALLARWSFGRSDLGPDHPPAGALRSALASSGREMVDGVRHLAAQRGAAYALLAQSGQRVLFGVLTLSALLMFRSPVAEDGNVAGAVPGLAAVFVGGAVGNLAASVLTPPVARRVSGWRWLTLLLALEGLAIAVFGPAFTPYLLAIAVFFVNLAGQGVKIVVDTDLQHECADDYRGRVFSLSDTMFNVSFVLGLFLAALVLPADGRSVEVLFSVALGFVVVAIWYAFTGGRWALRVGDDIAQPDLEVDKVTARV
ncbi:MFS transporter [Virgisporangium ochraceum]|uniref:MFS transporter n=1 Tax=Virgisporangium ochraceum TaxID=65505 RepID=A0A8J4E8I1_9ACTN|nr:MFS transporter [Virgisporangium ochraceum]